MRSDEVAWAAGFFEGEGGVYVARDKLHWIIRISIGQTDREPLERFREIFGVGGICPAGPSALSRKPLWQFYVQRLQDVEAIVKLMWPWLSERKRCQAKAAIDLVRSVRKYRVPASSVRTLK